MTTIEIILICLLVVQTVWFAVDKIVTMNNYKIYLGNTEKAEKNLERARKVIQDRDKFIDALQLERNIKLSCTGVEITPAGIRWIANDTPKEIV